MDIYEALQNIFNGRSALNRRDLRTVPNFPKETKAIHALAGACEKLQHAIKDSADLTDDETLTALVIKMANYSAKQGWTSPEKIEDSMMPQIPALADAINADPGQITQKKAGIAGILKRHGKKAEQDFASARQRMIDDPASPMRVLYTTPGGYRLVELFTPKHIIQQKNDIGGDSCLGTSYNHIMLARRGLEAGEKGSEKYLTYAMRIRSGQSRIFALQTPRPWPRSVLTIEYDRLDKRITQIEGHPKRIDKHSEYFPHLCECLDYLRCGELGDLTNISGLPEEKGKLLKTDGTFVDYTPGMGLSDILAGNLYAHPGTVGPEELARLAEFPGINLFLHSYYSRLLSETCPPVFKGSLTINSQEPLMIAQLSKVHGHLEIDAPVVDLPNLERVSGDCRSFMAEKILMPALSHCGGDYVAIKATEIDISSFRKSLADRRFTAPKLERLKIHESAEIPDQCGIVARRSHTRDDTRQPQQVITTAHQIPRL